MLRLGFMGWMESRTQHVCWSGRGFLAYLGIGVPVHKPVLCICLSIGPGFSWDEGMGVNQDFECT